ncbi:MAG: glucokinase, partial [Methylobacteriaceae bacterium]|nr:glucokinase [Methylobacteriaceae bacterium]
FRRRFEAKGRMHSVLEPVPAWLVLDGEPALRGLARAALDAAAPADGIRAHRLGDAAREAAPNRIAPAREHHS